MFCSWTIALGAVAAGVVLSSGGPGFGGPTYLFTRLNDLKPEMLAEATALQSQFAADADEPRRLAEEEQRARQRRVVDSGAEGAPPPRHPHRKPVVTDTGHAQRAVRWTWPVQAGEPSGRTVRGGCP